MDYAVGQKPACGYSEIISAIKLDYIGDTNFFIGDIILFYSRENERVFGTRFFYAWVGWVRGWVWVNGRGAGPFLLLGLLNLVVVGKRPW